MTYYIAENNERRGPYTLEQLATMSITADTLVWTEGMDSWERAETQEVLRAILISRSAASTSASAPLNEEEVPPLPLDEAPQQPVLQKRKRGRGCLLAFLCTIFALAIALWFTNPKAEAHQEALTELADDVVRDEMSNLTGGLGTTIAQSIVGGVMKTFFNDAFKTYNYHFFSITRFEMGNNNAIVSVGLLGHVFTGNKDVVVSYIHKKISNEVKNQVDNLKRQLIPTETLRELFDRFLGGAIDKFLGIPYDDQRGDSV